VTNYDVVAGAAMKIQAIAFRKTTA